MKKNRREALPENGGVKKKNILVTVLAVLAVTAVLLLIHRLSVVYRFYEVLMWIYMGALGASIIAFVVINRGFSNDSTLPSELPTEWTVAEKQKYLDEEKERHRRAKKLMYIILPIVIVIAVDFSELFLGDILDRLGFYALMSAIFGGGR